MNLSRNRLVGTLPTADAQVVTCASQVRAVRTAELSASRAPPLIVLHLSCQLVSKVSLKAKLISTLRIFQSAWAESSGSGGESQELRASFWAPGLLDARVSVLGAPACADDDREGCNRSHLKR